MTGINEAPFPPIPGYVKLWLDRYKRQGGRAGVKWSKATKSWVMYFGSPDSVDLKSGVTRIERELATNRVGRR